MKKSIFATIILSALLITSCSNAASSAQQPSSVAPSSEDSKSQSSSAAPSSAKVTSSSQATSSSKPTSSSVPASSSSAQSSDIPGGGNYLKKSVTVELEPSLAKPQVIDGETIPLSSYSLEFEYDDELFLTDAKKYNPDLSMLSLGATLASGLPDSGYAFFDEIEFTDVHEKDYYKEPSKDTMAYFLAHKVIDNYEVVTVALRGFNYGLEWANNLMIGNGDNHEGFDNCAPGIYSLLSRYITENVDKTKTLKLWINGYSRAGAMADLLSHYILTGDKFSVEQENMYVYTFEAPAALCEEYAIAYPNVHNIINKGDIVANIMPASYELYRCGTEYEIYNEDVSELVKDFDDNIDFPEFNIPEDNPMNAKNDVDVRDYILNSVFNSSNEDTTVTANTRDQYVNNYQDGLCGSIAYIFALSPATRSELLADLQALGTWEMIGVIGDATGESLANFMKPYLNKDNIEYDEEELVTNCAVLVKAIGSLGLSLLMMYAQEQYKPLITRLIDFHYPEVTYVLLQDAHRQQELIIEG